MKTVAAAEPPKQKCPLCSEPADHFYSDTRFNQIYFKCSCGLHFLDTSLHLNPSEELQRYELHKNELNSVDYQNFVAPLADAITQRLPKNSAGLDFGCGKAPIMSHMLEREGFKMSAYDPFFHSEKNALEGKYDFVVASEVAEHFYNPAEEFARLKKIIRPGGLLGLMTLLLTPTTDFPNWYYRRDPTHVVFYNDESLRWIQRHFGFRSLHILDQRTVIFEV